MDRKQRAVRLVFVSINHDSVRGKSKSPNKPLYSVKSKLTKHRLPKMGRIFMGMFGSLQPGNTRSAPVAKSHLSLRGRGRSRTSQSARFFSAKRCGSTSRILLRVYVGCPPQSPIFAFHHNTSVIYIKPLERNSSPPKKYRQKHTNSCHNLHQKGLAT